jgi:ribokinase
MPIDVVVVGSANLDLVATAHRLPGPGETVHGSTFTQHPGGKGLNQAVAAARAGASVALVGALGDDDAGTHLRSVAEHECIDTSHVAAVRNVPTGRALIVVADDAENSIVVVPGANGLVEFDVLPDDTSSGAVVLAQLEVPLDAVRAAFVAARDAGLRTMLNPAPAPVGGLPAELLELCDIIAPNEHEVDLLGGVEHLLSCGVGTVIITRGAAGVSVHEPTRVAPWTVEAFDVIPTDTTGAGDSFCGALAARLAAGDELAQAVRHGAAAGALATTAAGAVPSIPRAAAIEALVTTRPVAPDPRR